MKVFRLLLMLFAAGVAVISLFALISMLFKGGYEFMNVFWVAVRMILGAAAAYYIYKKRFKK